MSQARCCTPPELLCPSFTRPATLTSEAPQHWWHRAGGPRSDRPGFPVALRRHAEPPKTPHVAGVSSQQVLPCRPALRPALPGIPVRFSRLFLVCGAGSQHAPLSVSLRTRYRLRCAQKVREAQGRHLQEPCWVCWLSTAGYGEHHHGHLALGTPSQEDQAAGLQGHTGCSKSFVFIPGA